MSQWKTISALGGSVAAFLTILALVVSFGWQPVMSWQFEDHKVVLTEHIGKFEHEIQKELCDDCIDECWQWCPIKMNPEDCPEFCQGICERKCEYGD